MKLSIEELNDLYYCVGKVRMMDEDKRMIDNESLNLLLEKVSDMMMSEIDKDLVGQN